VLIETRDGLANERGWYTSVYAAILDSPEYQALSLDASAVWWALKLCPENNQLGVFPFFNEQVSARAKVPLERVQNALRELESGRWISTEGRFVWLRNHLKFDPTYAPTNPKHLSGLLSKLSALPRMRLTVDFVKYYKKIGYVPIPYRYGMPYPIHTLSIPDTDTNTEAVTDTDTKGQLVFDHWRTVMDHPDAVFSSERRRCVSARLAEGFTTQQLIDAIDGCKASAFHRGANEAGKVYDALTLICRNASKVDEFRAKRIEPGPPGASEKAVQRQGVAMAMIRGGMSDGNGVGPRDGSAVGEHEKPQLDAGDGDPSGADVTPADRALARR
jgi:hypothetical protein